MATVQFAMARLWSFGPEHRDRRGKLEYRRDARNEGARCSLSTW